METAIGSTLSTVITLLIVQWLSTRGNAEPTENEPPIKELKAEFRKFHIVRQVILLPLFALGVVFWWAVYFWIAHVRGAELRAEDPEFLLFIGDMGAWLWILPAFIPGLFTGAIFDKALTRVALGDRAKAYTRYEDRIDPLVAGTRQVSRSGGLLLAIPVLFLPFVFFFLLLDSHLLLTDDEIRISQFITFGEVSYPYSELDTIIASDTSIAPNGNKVSTWRFVLNFRDGLRWNSRWDPAGASDIELKEIASYIARQSGKEIEIVPVLTREMQ